MSPEPANEITRPEQAHLPGLVFIAKTLNFLRLAPFGLSAPDLLELFRERGWVLGDTRGPLQRLLRLLGRLQAEGLVLRQGRRYLLRTETFEARLKEQAEEAIRRALAAPFLVGDPALLQSALQTALVETLRERTSNVPSLPSNLIPTELP